MRKLLTALFMVMLFLSCSKNDDGDQDINAGDPDAMKYTISGLTDISLERSSEKTLVLGIAHTGGHQEKLTISVADLPANVTCTFDPQSGLPSFTAQLIFKASYKAAIGNYNIKVKATTEKDSVKTYDLKLTVTAATNCASEIAGNYTQNYICSFGSSNATVTISTTGVKDQVIITQLVGYPQPVLANLNCATKEINIPFQEFQQWEISGTGSFSNLDNLSFNYSATTGTSIANCTNNLTR